MYVCMYIYVCIYMYVYVCIYFRLRHNSTLLTSETRYLEATIATAIALGLLTVFLRRQFKRGSTKTQPGLTQKIFFTVKRYIQL